MPTLLASPRSFSLRSIARAMSTLPSTPVRLVLFDVFDTLCTPRIPIHEQYHEEAIKGGINPSTISPQSVRSAFKPAFKEMEATWPLYGKTANPAISPEEWWLKVIEKCLLHAGADPTAMEEKMGIIGPALLSRFESHKGYRNFEDTITCLKTLKHLKVKTSIISNADPRILHTLDSLSILPLLTYPPTLSYSVGHPKPHPQIFQTACQACGELPGEGVLVVGDELKADYRGAVNAGLEGRLIRRQGEWSDGAYRTQVEDLEGVHVMKGLEDIVEEVQRRNGRVQRQR